MAMSADLELSEVATRVAREIRAHREARGLSLSATAARAGLSKTILATIESGAGNPSLETLWRIARALDITVGTLLAEDEPVRIRLIPRADGEWLAFESGIRGRLIHVDGRDRRLEMLEMRLEPGKHHRSAAHAPGTEELVICLSGTLVLGPDGHEQRLGERDALQFAADVTHSYRSDDGCLALCSFTYPAVRSR
jgi:XRE family transcriptional regulator, regulator of sulfur utilization